MANEYRAALQEKRKPKVVCIEQTKLHVFCEKATYILLFVALLLLCAYAICSAL